jgi:hypothetical protein
MPLELPKTTSDIELFCKEFERLYKEKSKDWAGIQHNLGRMLIFNARGPCGCLRWKTTDGELKDFEFRLKNNEIVDEIIGIFPELSHLSRYVANK